MEHPFLYNPDLFSSCAVVSKLRRDENLHDVSHSTSSSIRRKNDSKVFSNYNNDEHDVDDENYKEYSCYRLFEQYTNHYGRPLPSFLSSDILERDPQLKLQFHRFVETVRFVYNHNNNLQQPKERRKLQGRSSEEAGEIAPTRPRYHVTLNRFADYEMNDADNYLLEGLEHMQQVTFWDHLWDHDDDHTKNSMFHGVPLTRLDDSNRILLESSRHTLAHQHHDPPPKHSHHKRPKDHKNSKGKERIETEIQPKKKKKKKKHKTEGPVIRVPINQTGPFANIDLPNEMDGIEINIKKPRNYKYTDQGREGDVFASSLNWATENNPDGVPLVHPAYNQGNCGSCWAFAATGTVETSAARAAAGKVFLEYMADSTNASDPKPYLRGSNKTDNIADVNTYPSLRSRQQDEMVFANALTMARMVEQNVFQSSNLSVQELLDCDTKYDEGCVGGNPVLAFPYIHTYGLISANDYPYIGDRTKKQRNDNKRIREDEWCELDHIEEGLSPPSKVATVKSWGILPRNREALIELVLRYIGPVAVGINGEDPTFLTYSGGIYDNEDCDSTVSNHALLIVGYGAELEEVRLKHHVKTQRLVRYWIARNSWGVGWGENGYVRIKRGDRNKGDPGICGIARSPSVALGGRFLLNGMFNQTDVFEGKDGKIVWNGSIDDDDIHHPHVFATFCERALGRSYLHGGCLFWARYFADHKGLSLAFAGIACAVVIAVWPLSFACRRRRKRVRRPSATLRLNSKNSPAGAGKNCTNSTNHQAPVSSVQSPEADEKTRLVVSEKCGYGSEI